MGYMKYNILPLVMSTLILPALAVPAQEAAKINISARETPVPKAVVDVLLAINTYHLNEISQSSEKLREQTVSQIHTLIQNSDLSDYVEFRIVGVHLYSVPDATLKKIGMVDSLREQYRADIVLDLGVLNSYQTNGQAYTSGMFGEFVYGNNPTPQEDAYLAEVDMVQSNSPDNNHIHVAAHELAHLLGGGHCATQYTQPWRGLYPFAAGAVDKQQGAVTILTYENSREHLCRKKETFKNLCVLSSPLPYEKDGIRYHIGDAQTDNRRCFLMTLPMVAGYREGSPTAVLNDTPQHAMELPPLYPLSYYMARFMECSNAAADIQLLACAEHAPQLFCGNKFTRIWGSTAHATHDATPGTAPNVWYRFTAPYTATYTAGFKPACGPGHSCRIYRKNGQEAIEIGTTPVAEAPHIDGGFSFRATQGEELYVEISALQESGIFNFFLAADSPVRPLPEFTDTYQVMQWEKEYSMSALLYAVLNPDPTDLKKLLQLSREYKQASSIPYLSVAAVLGHTEHCRQLLNGLDITDKNKQACRALLMATLAGQKETSALLKEAGATLNWEKPKEAANLIEPVCEHHCYRSLMRGVEAGIAVNLNMWDDYTIKRVSKSSKKNTQEERAHYMLHYAAEYGHTEAVRYLLNNGATVDTRSPHGGTALELAAYGGHTECVKLLLEAGANPDAVAQGATTSPLSQAASQGHADCVQLLLAAGAKADAAHHEEKTPLMLAMEINHTACIELLLPATTDLMAATRKGYTHLMAAACMETPDTLRLLLEKGADVNARSLDGNTALLKAAQYNRVGNIRLLLEHGADVNAQDTDGLTPLLLATQHGNTESTKLLLEHGADATLADKNKCTPLMQAARNGNSACLQLLLEHGAKDSYTRRQRTTALMAAATKGSADCVRLLLAAGSKVNARDDARMSPLCFAARQGHTECLQLLLEAGAKVVIRNQEGLSPLMLAVLNGHTDCARMLIQHGAAVNDASDNAESVLMQAAKRGHADCVKLLLEHGASVSATTPDGHTALSMAVYGGHADCVKTLLEAGAGTTPNLKTEASLLHLAVEEGDVTCIQLLCEAGAPVNLTDNDGYTPLMMALNADDEENIRAIIKQLLKHGADVHMKAVTDQTTAIHHAACYNTPATLELLLQAGANLHYRSANGETLLHLAAGHGNIQNIEFLLQRGADIHATDNRGFTPLHTAAAEGNALTVFRLISEGANLRALTAQGSNLYQCATASNDVQLLKYLAAKGLDPHHLNQEHLSALHVAIKNHAFLAVEHLLELGLDPNARTTDGRTPLMFASYIRSYDIELLLKHGADIHARDDKGQTALHYAALAEEAYLYKDLVKHGADPEAKDNNGKTPYMIAKEAKQKRDDAEYEKQPNADPVGDIVRSRIKIFEL